MVNKDFQYFSSQYGKCWSQLSMLMLIQFFSVFLLCVLLYDLITPTNSLTIGYIWRVTKYCIVLYCCVAFWYCLYVLVYVHLSFCCLMA